MQDDINVTYTQNLKEKMSESNLKKSMSIENVATENENMEVVNRAKTHDIEIAKKLALILSQQRSTAQSTWIEVGYCLHSISPTLLPAWIGFSKKWELWVDRKDCEKQWELYNKNNNNNYTI